MNRLLISLILAFAVVAIAGCPKPQQPAGNAAAASATAQPGSPATGREGKVETQTPSSASKNAPLPADWPSNWPADLPQYPGSTVTAATTNSTSAGVFMAVMMRTTDSPDAVLAFYDKAVLAAGYEKKVNIKLPGGGGTASYEKGSKSLSVKVDRPTGETQTGVQLLLKFKSAPPSNAVPPAAGTPGK